MSMNWGVTENGGFPPIHGFAQRENDGINHLFPGNVNVLSNNADIAKRNMGNVDLIIRIGANSPSSDRHNPE